MILDASFFMLVCVGLGFRVCVGLYHNLWLTIIAINDLKHCWLFYTSSLCGSRPFEAENHLKLLLGTMLLTG